MFTQEKSSIRSSLINKRDSLSSDIWTYNSNMIQRSIIRSAMYRECDCLLIYADYHGEVGTLTLVDDALINGKEVYLPKVLEGFDEARMEFYRIFSSHELVNGYKGIREPLGNFERAFDYEAYKDKNVLMLVPGVAFDKRGFRLGYGKGYYDNYLKNKPSVMKVGICFSMQICDELPASDNDVKLDFIVSENTKTQEIIDFYKNRRV